MAKVTVQAIADRLGVSKFAVSRALNGKPGVSKQTRDDILELAEELGYVIRPKRHRTRSIEVIYHDPDVALREVWTEIQAGTQSEAARLGIETAVRWTDDPAIVERLKDTALGFILIGPHEPSVIDGARATGLPCVRIGELPLLDRMDQVASSDQESARAVAEYLLGLGHRRFVYVHGKPGYRGRIERHRTFVQVASATPGAIVRDMAFHADDAPADFRQNFLALVREGFEPTAFFCGNDGVAVTVVSELIRLGLRVPQDASVVGHADYAIATQIAPQLTTVRVPHHAMGVAAVRLLVSRTGGYGPVNDLPPHRIVMIDELTVRETTAPPPSRSWLPRLKGHVADA